MSERLAYVVFLSELLVEWSGHDSPPHAGGRTEVRFPRLPPRRVDSCRLREYQAVFSRLNVLDAIPELTFAMAVDDLEAGPVCVKIEFPKSRCAPVDSLTVAVHPTEGRSSHFNFPQVGATVSNSPGEPPDAPGHFLANPTLSADPPPGSCERDFPAGLRKACNLTPYHFPVLTLPSSRRSQVAPNGPIIDSG